MTPDPSSVTAWLDRMACLARNRGFRVVSMGKAGRFEIPAMVKPREGKPRIYLSAGIHGDEPAGPLAIERLMENSFFDEVGSWTVCPLLNPGGMALGKRTNPEGIDLNRDYLKADSLEVQSHRRWLEKTPAHDLYISLHEDWEASGFYLYEIDTSGRPFSLCREILLAVQQVIPIENNPCIDDHAVAAPGFIRHAPEPDDPKGWPEAIFHAKLYPHLSYTMETPSSFPLDQRVSAHVAGVKAAARAHARASPGSA